MYSANAPSITVSTTADCQTCGNLPKCTNRLLAAKPSAIALMTSAAMCIPLRLLKAQAFISSSMSVVTNSDKPTDTPTHLLAVSSCIICIVVKLNTVDAPNKHSDSKLFLFMFALYHNQQGNVTTIFSFNAILIRL